MPESKGMWREEDVRDLVRDVIEDTGYTERNTEIRKRRTFLRGRHDVLVPNVTDRQGGGSGAQYHPPKARRDAIDYAETILRLDPDIEYAAAADSDKAADAAQRVKNTIKMEYARWRQQNSFDGAAFDLAGVHHGELALHLNLDVLPIVPMPNDGESETDYAARAAPVLEEFAKGEAGDLFQVESVPCETVYDTTDGLARILASELPVAQLRKAYAKPGAGGYAATDDGMGKAIEIAKDGAVSVGTFAGQDIREGRDQWAKTVTLYIVSTADYCYHLLLDGSGKYENDKLIGCYRNYFGVPQFIPAWGHLTGDTHPLFAATPLIDGLFDIEPFVQMFGTMIMDGGIRATQTRRQLVDVAGEAAAQARGKAAIKIEELPGGIVKPPDGRKLEPLGDLIPAEAINALTMFMEQSQQIGFPPIMRNPQEFDAQSGYDRAKAQDAVSAAMDKPLENWGNAISSIFRARLTAQKALGVDLTIRSLHPSKKIGPAPQSVQKAVTLKADEIQDGYLALRFDSTTFYTQAAQQEQDLILLEKRLMSTDEFHRRRGVEDVSRMYDEQDASDMRALARKDALADAVGMRDAMRSLLAGEALTAANLDKLYAATTGEDVTTPTENTNLNAPSPRPEAEMGQAQGAEVAY